MDLFAGATAPQRRKLSSGAYLGVERSVRGFRWAERLSAEQRAIGEAIAQQHGLPEILGRVLAGRGVGVEDVDLYLNPTVRELMPDPATLRDMAPAAARLADAIERRSRIAIFGDYDVDGACSSALMQLFLRAHDLTGRIYIPDRMSEGYGPNPDAIRALVKEGAELIVTVDCGTTSFAPLEAARELDTDVIVIDHHQADETLPHAVAVVNPNRQDDLSGLGHLCAAGVVFMTLVATQRELRARGYYADDRRPPDLLALLDLVALATVCDVVPLLGLNRAFVVKGLEVMKRRRNVGLVALFDAAGLSQAPTTYHLGFILGPRINAGGRIGDSGLGARLLSTTDGTEAAKIAATLDRLNRERKAMETQILEAATATAEARLDAEPDLPVLVVGADDWHKGVVGLVASRLTDRFRRPSCVIAWDGSGQGTASLRSIAGVDIGTAVRGAVSAGLLVKGGGHAMAAGLTVTRDKFDALADYLAGELSDSSSAARQAASLDIDGALLPRAANAEFMSLIERAGPYGQDNPQPRFVFPAHRVRFSKVVGDAHVKCTFEASDGTRIDGVAFRAAGQPIGEALLAGSARPLHVAGTLKKDDWGGRERIELFIDDVADPETCAG